LDASERDAAQIWAELHGSVPEPCTVVLMGVSGSGKTTIGALLVAGMHWNFLEGDDLHPAANVEKMRQGQPLNDADREPWLRAIAAVIDRWRAAGRSGVVACSALKRAYRDILIGPRTDVTLVYLQGSKELIAMRLAARHGHFMPVALLDSQFATLEEPTPEENPITIPISGQPHDIVVAIIRALAARGAGRVQPRPA